MYWSPFDLAVDGSNSIIYVADKNNNAVRKITLSSQTTTLFGDQSNLNIDGSTAVAKIGKPHGIDFVVSGGDLILYVSTNNFRTVRKVNIATSTVSSLTTPQTTNAYTDGPVATARFGYGPYNIFAHIAPGGNTHVYLTSDGYQNIRVIDETAGSVHTVANPTQSSGYVDGSGNISKFSSPFGVTAFKGSAGPLYVADYGNNVIRMIKLITSSPTQSPSGTPTSQPSNSPATVAPTMSPSKEPTTVSPITFAPSASPVTLSPITSSPLTSSSLSPTGQPSTSPSICPSHGPFVSPTKLPTAIPTSSSSTPSPSQTPISLEQTVPIMVSAEIDDAVSLFTFSCDIIFFLHFVHNVYLLFTNTNVCCIQISRIKITFNSSTNRPSSLGCQILKNISVALLGSKPTCVWASAKILYINLGYQFSLGPGSLLSIRPNVISSVSGTNSPAHSIQIGDFNVIPSVSIAVSHPQTLGGCDVVSEVRTITSGGAGRPLLFSWRLQSADPPDSIALTQSLSALILKVDSSTLIIPALNLTMGTTYFFNVTATSWLNATASTYFSIGKLNTSTPVIYLPSSTTINTYRSQQLDIRVQAKPPFCNQSLTSPPTGLSIKGEWTQLSGPTSIVIPDPHSIYLRLPKWTFAHGPSTYLLNLHVVALDSLGREIGAQNVTFTVHLLVGKLVARIAGGSSRTISRVTTPWLILDGSNSRDYMNSSALLFYTWSVSANSSTMVQLALNSTFSSFNLSTLSLKYGVTHRILLNVTSLASGRTIATRTAGAEQTLLIENNNAPAVSVDLQTLEVPNPDENLILRGDIYSVGSNTYTYSWQCTSGNLNLNDPYTARTSLSEKFFVIASEALLPNTMYTFVLFAISSTSQSADGKASITIKTNAPPRLGICSATPSSGLALDTLFHFECSGWEDEDIPLRYRYEQVQGWKTKEVGNHIELDEDSFLYLDICQLRHLPYYRSVLPFRKAEYLKKSGKWIRNDFLELANTSLIRTSIVDNMGAASYTYIELNISLPESVNYKMIKDELDKKLKEGDTQSYSVLYSAMASYLKTNRSVDLTESPSVTPVGIRNALLESLRTTIPYQNGSNAKAARVISAKTSTALLEVTLDYKKVIGISRRTTAQGLELLTDSLAVARNSELRFSDMMSTVISSITAASHVVAHSAESTTDDSVGTERLDNILATNLGDILFDIPFIVLNHSAVGEQSSVGSSIGNRKQSIHFACRRLYSKDLAGTALSTQSSTATVAFLNSSINSSTIQISLIGIKEDPLYFITKNETIIYGGASMVQICEESVEGASQTRSVCKACSAKNLQRSRENASCLADSSSITNFTFTIPVGAGGTVDSSSGLVSKPVLWNGSSWQRREIRVKTPNGSRSLYETSTNSPRRLTFSNSWVHIELNTYDEATLRNPDIYDPRKNGALAFVLGLLVAYVVLFVVAYFYDGRGIGGGQELKFTLCSNSMDFEEIVAREKSFWRELNSNKKAKMDKDRSCKSLCFSLRWGLRSTHPWSSVIMRHPGDFMNSQKRLTALFVTLLNTTTVVALLLGTNQRILFLNNFYSTMIVAFIIGYPIPFTFGKLLQRTKPRSLRLKLQATQDWISKIPCLLFLCSLFISQEAGIGETIEGENADAEVEYEDEGEGGDAKVNGDDNPDEIEQKLAPGQILNKSVSLHMSPIGKQIERSDTLFGVALNPLNPLLRTQEWACLDVITIIFAFFIMLGCSFVIATLLWQVEGNNSELWSSALASFGNDICMRFFALFIIDSIFLFPLCLEKKSRVRTLKEPGCRETVTVSSDAKTCLLDKNSRVLYVFDAGEQLGIKKGWRVLEVNGKQVENASQAKAEIQLAHATAPSFEVSFEIDQTVVDQATEDEEHCPSVIRDMHSRSRSVVAISSSILLGKHVETK
eukprot:jgi/Bigna1/80040/fgenesh1_pg.67_\